MEQIKKFKELSIGDKVFYYGNNIDKPMEGYFIVESLSLLDKKLKITGGVYYLLLDDTESEKNILITNSISYTTSDLMKKSILKEVALGLIKERQAYIRRNEKEIEEIRKIYWEFLN